MTTISIEKKREQIRKILRVVETLRLKVANKGGNAASKIDALIAKIVARSAELDNDDFESILAELLRLVHELENELDQSEKEELLNLCKKSSLEMQQFINREAEKEHESLALSSENARAVINMLDRIKLRNQEESNRNKVEGKVSPPERTVELAKRAIEGLVASQKAPQMKAEEKAQEINQAKKL